MMNNEKQVNDVETATYKKKGETMYRTKKDKAF